MSFGEVPQSISAEMKDVVIYGYILARLYYQTLV